MQSTEVIRSIEDQDLIGWKNLLEGLPTRRWKLLQQRHYNRDSYSRKTGRRWTINLLKELHNRAWNQWDHCNKVNKDESPREKEADCLLNDEIITEFIRGNDDLPARDLSYFNLSLLDLLDRARDYRKAWLQNVQSARDRQAKRRGEELDAIAESQSRSAVLQWIKTGHPPYGQQVTCYYYYSVTCKITQSLLTNWTQIAGRIS